MGLYLRGVKRERVGHTQLEGIAVSISHTLTTALGCDVQLECYSILSTLSSFDNPNSRSLTNEIDMCFFKFFLMFGRVCEGIKLSWLEQNYAFRGLEYRCFRKIFLPELSIGGEVVLRLLQMFYVTAAANS